MSDSEEYSSEESYEFEFEDENEEMVEEQVPDSDLENKYYYAKGLKDDSTSTAIKEFEAIVSYEATSQDDFTWCFRACKQLIKVYYKSGLLDKVLLLVQHLTKLAPKVGSVYAEESIGRLLNHYSVSLDGEFVKKLYDIILTYIHNEDSPGASRIWLKIHISKAALLLEERQLDASYELIKEIKTQLEDSSENVQNAFSIECLALEIEYYSLLLAFENLSILQDLYRNSLNASTALTHPRIIGIIRECGGKVYFYLRNFEKARLEFYDSFKSYDEAGSIHKKRLLKYLTLCSLIAENEVNPFESQETQSYAQLPDYSDLISMIKQYDELNLDGFDQAVAKIEKDDEILGNDDIFHRATQLIKHNLRSKILINLLKSYKSIRFQYILDMLHISQDELEHLVIHLSNQGRVSGISMDFFDNIIEVDHTPTVPFPSQVHHSDIMNNINALGALNFGSSRSETRNVDEEGRHVFAKELLLGSTATSTYYGISHVTEWLQCLISAIPGRAKALMSQKDQIYFEQRAETAPENVKIDTEEKDNEATETEITTTRVSLLNWCREIRTWQKKVSAH